MGWMWREFLGWGDGISLRCVSCLVLESAIFTIIGGKSVSEFEWFGTLEIGMKVVILLIEMDVL